MIILLFGKPGAGKGTQAPLLAAALGVPTLATGDELRAAIRNATPLGLEAKSFMDRGDLVPDAVILGIIKAALSEPRHTRGVLLDGVVRTVPQAEGLAAVCEELGQEVKAVLCFDIDDEEIVRRLAGRTTSFAHDHRSFRKARSGKGNPGAAARSGAWRSDPGHRGRASRGHP